MQRKTARKRPTSSAAAPGPITPATRHATACPTCCAAIDAQATVDEFGQPPKWVFWGVPGERWRRCQGEQGGYRFIHFRVLVDGRLSERLAWTRQQEETPASQPSMI